MVTRASVLLYVSLWPFQSVMFDKDTLIVSYDSERGESRGSRKKNIDHKEAGLG
jgi:polyferredoxin